MENLSTLLNAPEIQVASAIPALRSSILLLAFIAIFALGGLIASRHFPDLGFKARGLFRQIKLFFFGAKFEAKLSETVCNICKKGTGIFDPLYLSYKGEPHVEGNCNCCGAYVRIHLH